jgi:hypothetical protein
MKIFRKFALMLKKEVALNVKKIINEKYDGD